MKYIKDILLLMALGVILWLLLRPSPVKVREVIRCDTLEVVRVDTLVLQKPVYVTRRVVDTFRLIVRQTDTVYLPREQRRYEDSLYTAWVSGYRPRLDSIRIYPRERIRYITRETRRKEKTRRWGISLQAGYGLTKDGFSPYAGLGISYNLFSW